jgi:hypothetical protein
MKFCTMSGCQEVIADSELYCVNHKRAQTSALVRSAQQIQKDNSVKGEIQITRESGNVYSGDYQCQTMTYDTYSGRYDSKSTAYNLYKK